MANLCIKRKWKLFLYIEFLVVFLIKKKVKNIIKEVLLTYGVLGHASMINAL